MALVMVAKDRGFFDRQGLNVELREFTAGKFALQAFLGGSLDFAVAGDVPVTLATLQGSRFKVITQVVDETRNEVRVVARRDPTTSNAHDYFTKRKRKIATSLGGGPEFFTYNFLKKHGISSSQIEIVSQKPEDMPVTLAKGDVDAISVFDPFAFIAEQQMGDEGVTFTEPDIYSELYLLTAHEETIAEDQQSVERLLRALVMAEDFIKQDPAEAQAIVSKYTRLDGSVVQGIWNNFVFAPSLNERLLQYQQQETAWAKEVGTVDASVVTPDFREFIEADILKTIKPEAVRLP